MDLDLQASKHQRNLHVLRSITTLSTSDVTCRCSLGSWAIAECCDELARLRPGRLSSCFRRQKKGACLFQPSKPTEGSPHWWPITTRNLDCLSHPQGEKFRPA